MSLISMLCPRCLGDSFERDHAYKCRPPELDMTPTFPPSPAQGETAGVSEVPSYYLRDISGHLHRVVLLSDHEAAMITLRQQLAELQREKAAAVGLQQGTALVVKQLEQQQLADSAHEVERLNAANAAMRGLIERVHARSCGSYAESAVCEQLEDVHTMTENWLNAHPLAPTSHDPVRSAGEPRHVPSRGKCETCGGSREIDRFPNHLTDELIERCPDCAQGGSPADPERQVPDILNELIGDGKYRYNLNDDQINALRELIKPSPPQDDIVAGLRACKRDDLGAMLRIAAALCATVPDPEFPPRMNREARHRIAREADIADGQCKGFAIVLRDIFGRVNAALDRAIAALKGAK